MTLEPTRRFVDAHSAPVSAGGRSPPALALAAWRQCRRRPGSRPRPARRRGDRRHATRRPTSRSRARRARRAASPGAQAANDAEVDAAFAAARAENKPVFVYWGAKWCPPCNQVQATLFNRQDFIERSRAFVPVYVDGDSPGAQKIGARFQVSGYPTMVLFSAAGPGADAAAGRGRAGPLHRGADARHERGAAGQGGARRCPRRPAPLTRERLAPARLLFVGHRRAAGGRQGRACRRPAGALADACPDERARRRRCGCA